MYDARGAGACWVAGVVAELRRVKNVKISPICSPPCSGLPISFCPIWIDNEIEDQQGYPPNQDWALFGGTHDFDRTFAPLQVEPDVFIIVDVHESAGRSHAPFSTRALAPLLDELQRQAQKWGFHIDHRVCDFHLTNGLGMKRPLVHFERTHDMVWTT